MKITVKSIIAALSLVVSMSQVMPMAFADDAALPTGNLTSEINYRYVGHLEQTDDKGRLLVWEGEPLKVILPARSNGGS